MPRRLFDLASAALVVAGAVALLTGWAPRPAGTRAPRRAPEPLGLAVAAASPAHLPAAGWKAILSDTFKGISKDRILAEAAGVTFFGLLALFPAMAALISVYGLFADPNTVSDRLQALSGVLPGGGIDIIGAQLHALTSSPPRALGLGAIIGLLTSLWSANAGIKAMFDALNAVYEETEKRSYVALLWRSLLFTVGSIVFLIFALTALVVAPAVTRWIGSPLVDSAVSFGRWPAMLVVVTLFLSVLYRYGPCRGSAPWRWVSWGGLLASVLWLLVSAAFSYYTAHFGSYNKTYGSLGGAVGFMTWIWLSTSVVLLGGELDAQMERRAGGSVGHGRIRGS